MHGLTRDAFDASPEKGITINGFRARLFKASEIPYLERAALDADVSEIILFDSFQPRTDLKYINAITGKVIETDGFYKEKDATDTATIPTTPFSTHESDENKENNSLVSIIDTDATMQPLKVDFLDFKKLRSNLKTTHVPVQLVAPIYKFTADLNPTTFKQASDLVNAFRVHRSKIDIQLKNVWMVVATDAQNVLKTLLAGWATDGPLCVVYVGQGVTGVDAVNNFKLTVNRPPSMWKAHAEYAPIKQRMLEDGSIDEYTAKVTMAVSWKSPHDIVALSPPAHNAKVSVTVYPGYMDGSWLNFSRCHDLSVLLNLHKWIIAETAEFPSIKLDEDMVIDVKTLLQTYKQNSHQIGQDFLFDLWNILRNVSSHATLKACFGLVLRDIKSGSLKVFMKPNYTSTIANLCRTHEVIEVSMRPLEVLNCAYLLLEIGTDVLRVQYCLDFINANYIPAAGVLETLMGETTLDVHKRVERLLPIHQAYITMELFRMVLELDKTWKANVTKLVLHRFTTTKEPIEKTNFVLNIGSSHVREGVVKINDVASWTKQIVVPVVGGFGADNYMTLSRELDFKHFSSRIYVPLKEKPSSVNSHASFNESKIKNNVTMEKDFHEKLSITLDDMESDEKDEIDTREPFFAVRTYVSKYFFKMQQ